MLKSLESKNEPVAESDMFSKKKMGTQKNIKCICLLSVLFCLKSCRSLSPFFAFFTHVPLNWARV